MAGILATCQEQCRNTWDGTGFHRPPSAAMNHPSNAVMTPSPATNLVRRLAQRPALPLLSPLPSTPVVTVPREVIVPQQFVEDDNGDLDINEAEESVLRELEQLGHARGRGRYTCPLREACQKGGLDNQGELKIFEQNGTYRLGNPTLLPSIWVS